jgi:hypothetical protein
MSPEELSSFSDRVGSRLGATLESIAYYPHPFTNGGLILLFRRDTGRLTSIIPDVFRCGPPPGLPLHFLRSHELFQLSLPGVFKFPLFVNEQPHLAFWLKHKGTVLYGHDFREEVKVNADLPGLLINHIEACQLHLRPRVLLFRLSRGEYALMLKTFDAHLRHLMATALLVHNCWDVTTETVPHLFAEYYTNEALRSAWEEFTGIQEGIGEMGENEQRKKALEAAWLCESFLLRLREQAS